MSLRRRLKHTRVLVRSYYVVPTNSTLSCWKFLQLPVKADADWPCPFRGLPVAGSAKGFKFLWTIDFIHVQLSVWRNTPLNGLCRLTLWCCRRCALLAGLKTYCLINKAGTFSCAWSALCQYNEASLEEKKKHVLCHHCCRELNVLSNVKWSWYEILIEVLRKWKRQIYISAKWKDIEEIRWWFNSKYTHEGEHYAIGKALYFRCYAVIALKDLHVLGYSTSLLYQQRVQPVFLTGIEAC